MKARDIRVMLKDRVDPYVVNCMCAMAENQAAQAQEIKMLADMLNSAMDVLLQLGATVEGATNAVDAIKKHRME